MSSGFHNKQSFLTALEERLQSFHRANPVALSIEVFCALSDVLQQVLQCPHTPSLRYLKPSSPLCWKLFGTSVSGAKDLLECIGFVPKPVDVSDPQGKSGAELFLQPQFDEFLGDVVNALARWVAVMPDEGEGEKEGSGEGEEEEGEMEVDVRKGKKRQKVKVRKVTVCVCVCCQTLLFVFSLGQQKAQ